MMSMYEHISIFASNKLGDVVLTCVEYICELSDNVVVCLCARFVCIEFDDLSNFQHMNCPLSPF